MQSTRPRWIHVHQNAVVRLEVEVQSFICPDYIGQGNHPNSYHSMGMVLECLRPFDYGKGFGDFGNFRHVLILLRLEGLPLNLKILDDVVPTHTHHSQVMTHGVVVSNQLAGDSQALVGFCPKHENWRWGSLTSSCTWIGVGDSSPRALEVVRQLF